MHTVGTTCHCSVTSGDPLLVILVLQSNSLLETLVDSLSMFHSLLTLRNETRVFRSLSVNLQFPIRKLSQDRYDVLLTTYFRLTLRIVNHQPLISPSSVVPFYLSRCVETINVYLHLRNYYLDGKNPKVQIFQRTVTQIVTRSVTSIICYFIISPPSRSSLKVRKYVKTN